MSTAARLTLSRTEGEAMYNDRLTLVPWRQHFDTAELLLDYTLHRMGVNTDRLYHPVLISEVWPPLLSDPHPPLLLIPRTASTRALCHLDPPSDGCSLLAGHCTGLQPRPCLPVVLVPTCLTPPTRAHSPQPSELFLGALRTSGCLAF